MNCERCRKETLCTVCSMFNTQEICIDCKDVETEHPRYAEARTAEADAVRSGNMNFRGIGLPRELMKRSKDEPIFFTPDCPTPGCTNGLESEWELTHRLCAECNPAT